MKSLLCRPGPRAGSAGASPGTTGFETPHGGLEVAASTTRSFFPAILIALALAVTLGLHLASDARAAAPWPDYVVGTWEVDVAREADPAVPYSGRVSVRKTAGAGAFVYVARALGDVTVSRGCPPFPHGTIIGMFRAPSAAVGTNENVNEYTGWWFDQNSNQGCVREKHSAILWVNITGRTVANPWCQPPALDPGYLCLDFIGDHFLRKVEGPRLEDTKRPRVRAWRASARRGKSVRLRFWVADDSGTVTVTVWVARGRRVIARRTHRNVSARPKGERHFQPFSAPRRRGTLRWCVRAKDDEGNGRTKCAVLRVR